MKCLFLLMQLMNSYFDSPVSQCWPVWPFRAASGCELFAEPHESSPVFLSANQQKKRSKKVTIHKHSSIIKKDVLFSNDTFFYSSVIREIKYSCLLLHIFKY